MIGVYYGWREPPDWSPIWMGPNEYGYYPLANEPRLGFRYLDSGIRPVRLWSGRTGQSLEQGQLSGSYLVFDEEHKRFLGQVWRILGKLTTNELVAIDVDTGRAIAPPGKGGFVWAGYHALEWCRQSNDRFLDGNLRPADEYEKWT